MRPRKTFLIAAVLVGWIFTTYLIFLKNFKDSDPKKDHEMMQKIRFLEKTIQLEENSRDKLYREIINILQKEDKATSTEAVPLKGNGDAEEQPPQIPVAEFPPRPEAEVILSKFEHKFIDGDVNNPVIPVLVFACNRLSVNKCLDDLIRYRPRADQFPIIVSQDCDDEATRSMILSYKENVTLIRQPDQSDVTVLPKEKKYKGYYKISRHYGWALKTVFKQGFESIIIVEDDLSIAPDFYEYFLGTYPILKKDRSLWCTSAWNDNGKEGLIDGAASELLYRSDFFPGLGWMMTKELWNELAPKWPRAFWDDWIRQPEQRKERACIRPELPRTRTFGKVGVSNGLFFDKHLKFIKLSEDFVTFTKMNLTYLQKSIYDETFLNTVYQSDVVTLDELKRGLVKTKNPVRITYLTKEQYKRATKSLGLMDDFKSGVPRTAYLGVVSFFYNGQRVYLAPNTNWKGYDLTWS
uniref:Alpha-1,3-mannosyl-glycoprotein 2-beta-N-acetylglucosaminyltransferase n=1 Tax=Culex pipiens TaxID=7175 RepID=A0A8D8DLD5_CULPI